MGKWINRIGVELEIEVDRDADGRIPTIDGFNATSDGSIRSCDGGDAVEYVTEPFEYCNAGVPELEAGVRRLYEEHNARANATMGLHMHVSFNRRFYYYALASMRFYQHFMDHVRASDLWDRNARLRERAEGVQYAQPIQSHTELDYSLKRTPGGSRRYRHFIYRPNMETIEFRLFPAMDSARDVLAAVDIVTAAINSYLAAKKYELDEELVVEVQTTDVRDRRSIEEVVQYV